MVFDFWPGDTRNGILHVHPWPLFCCTAAPGAGGSSNLASCTVWMLPPLGLTGGGRPADDLAGTGASTATNASDMGAGMAITGALEADDDDADADGTGLAT